MPRLPVTSTGTRARAAATVLFAAGTVVAAPTVAADLTPDPAVPVGQSTTSTHSVPTVPTTEPPDDSTTTTGEPSDTTTTSDPDGTSTTGPDGTTTTTAPVDTTMASTIVTRPNTTARPRVTTTTAPPSAPTTAPTTTIFVQGSTRATQDTPDLGGVLALWLVGIAGSASILGYSWWQRRP